LRRRIASRTSVRTRFQATVALLAAVVLAAWGVSAWLEVGGGGAGLHHHALYHSGLPLWWAAILLLGAWQVMTAAMMLPTSLPLIHLFVSVAQGKPGFRAAVTLFLLAYFGVWTGFALAAFIGDMELHRLVHAWPWLRSHPEIIPAATLSIAAVYQVTPLKNACLRECRDPRAYLVRHYRRGALGGFELGLGHGIYCLGCCWALMLLMFAAGVAHLGWMGVLAAVMLGEKTFPGGQRLTQPLGLALALLALGTLILPGGIFGL
jgi:predicted metal-binding membrane protein